MLKVLIYVAPTPVDGLAEAVFFKFIRLFYCGTAHGLETESPLTRNICRLSGWSWSLFLSSVFLWMSLHIWSTQGFSGYWSSLPSFTIWDHDFPYPTPRTQFQWIFWFLIVARHITITLVFCVFLISIFLLDFWPVAYFNSEYYI